MMYLVTLKCLVEYDTAFGMFFILRIRIKIVNLTEVPFHTIKYQ